MGADQTCPNSSLSSSGQHPVRLPVQAKPDILRLGPSHSHFSSHNNVPVLVDASRRKRRTSFYRRDHPSLLGCGIAGHFRRASGNRQKRLSLHRQVCPVSSIHHYFICHKLSHRHLNSTQKNQNAVDSFQTDLPLAG